MAGTAVLLQPRSYWADCQPATASQAPNKCHAGDGQQEYASYPNAVPNMLRTNLQALFNGIMLSAISVIYVCLAVIWLGCSMLAAPQTLLSICKTPVTI